MPIANAKDLLLKAGRGGYAVGAFNVTHLVQMEAAVEAAAVKKAPLIIQVSAKTAQFLNAEVMAAAFKALAQSAPVPLCLHLDHCAAMDGPAGLLGEGMSAGRRSRDRHETGQPRMGAIQALFFDQDGVIIDTERDGHRVAFNQAFREFQIGHSLREDGRSEGVLRP